MKIADIIGKKFGKLTVLEQSVRPAHIKTRDAYFLCKCDCGQLKSGLGRSLVRGELKSCGCLRKEQKQNTLTKRAVRRKELDSFTAINDSIITEVILKDPNYDVRIDGTIWTLYSTNGCGITNIWRKASKVCSNGYAELRFRWNGQNKRLRVHRIIYAKYVGILIPELVINHKNGNRSDNVPENLELVTTAVNNQHSIEVLKNDPLQRKKIDLTIAQEIRALKKAGWSYKQLIAKYGLSKGNISSIVNNKIWKTTVIELEIR